MATQPPRNRAILVPPMNSFEDVRQVLGQHLNDLQSRFVQSLPLTSIQGHRLQDVGDPQAPNDAVNLSFLTGYVLPQLQTASTARGSNVLLRVVTPTGTMNGSNLVFNLPDSPILGWVFLFVNGVYQQPTSDYTLASKVITFTVAPKASDYSLIALYLLLGN